MEIVYHTVNLTLRPAEREVVQKQLQRVDAALRLFSEPVAHIEIERSEKKGGIGVGLHVKMPTGSLFATAWEENLRGAVELAVDKVVRQARKHLEHLRKEQRAGADSLRMPKPPREPTASEMASMRDLEDFRDRAAHQAARLSDMLRRERRLDPRAEAAGGRISIPDIVEEALVHVFEHFREKPVSMSVERWLMRRGLLILDQELGRTTSVTASSIPRPEPEAREDWEDLMDLPVLDPGPLESRPADAARAAPEVIRDRREAQLATAAALSELPERQRKALLLRHLESYEIPEIAYVLGSTDETVDRWLLEAEVALQDRLRDWRSL